MRLFLEIKKNGRFMSFYEIAHRKTIIGSKSGNIVLHDSQVSPIHLCIRIEGKRVLIEDLHSKTGTIVGDRKINDEHVLKKDETIIIGPFTISFILAKSKKNLGMLMDYEGDRITNYENTFRPHCFTLKALEK